MAAVNEAQRKSAQDAEESMGAVTGGMNMPGLF
jgi:DNA-binding protein YbaB